MEEAPGERRISKYMMTTESLWGGNHMLNMILAPMRIPFTVSMKMTNARKGLAGDVLYLVQIQMLRGSIWVRILV